MRRELDFYDRSMMRFRLAETAVELIEECLPLGTSALGRAIDRVLEEQGSAYESIREGADDVG